MAYEILVGLEVSDMEAYAKYREAMAPYLAKYGGKFMSDFMVSETLKPSDKQNINRVFTISFPDKQAEDDFFADPEYKIVKKKYFEPSVKVSYWLAKFES